MVDAGHDIFGPTFCVSQKVVFFSDRWFTLIFSQGGVAKWLGTALQKRLRRFNSARHLQVIKIVSESKIKNLRVVSGGRIQKKN
jgi:hypothetical protein